MKTLISQLRAWRRREWLLDLAWAGGRLFALVLVVVPLACLTDWLTDRFAESAVYQIGHWLRDVIRWVNAPQLPDTVAAFFAGTPMLVRVLLALGQLLVYGFAAYLLLFRLKAPSLVTLAGRAERAIPAFDHRLVTAIQLNRPNAQTLGMSKQLIGDVTREAEQMSSRHSLASLADPARLKWALAVVVPLLLVAGLYAAVKPRLTAAMLGRQLLLPLDIPRSVKLENATPELWPSGDSVEIRLLVTGPVNDDDLGDVRVYPEGLPSERLPLTLARRRDDGRAEFTATYAPSSTPFTVRTWLRDGRLKEPGAVRFEPRPVVSEVNAWVLLPAYVDPAGKNRFERAQPQGEVVALADSAVRVTVATSKPVATATLVLFARDEQGREKEARRIPMAVGAEQHDAGVVFDLPPRPSRYAVEVTDLNGFANAHPPRRGITLAPDNLPEVKLLTETLKGPLDEGPPDDYEAAGMPLALGGQVQIGYTARSPLGLSRARIIYKVNDGPWTPLPLARVDADPEKVGRFVPELGLFERSGYNAQVEFYPIPAADPEREPPGLDAGGRYNFQTAALTKVTDDGKTAKLEVGDRVEFYVEAFDRKPDPNRPAGRSESRLKTVVTQAQLMAWIDQHDQSRERLRKLEEGQRGVFGQPSK